MREGGREEVREGRGEGGIILSHTHWSHRVKWIHREKVQRQDSAKFLYTPMYKTTVKLRQVFEISIIDNTSLAQLDRNTI